MVKQKKIKVVQVASPIGRQGYQKKCLIGLGLNKINRSRVLIYNESIFGIDNIKYFEELSILLKKSHEYLKLKLPLENKSSNKNDILKNHRIHVYSMKEK